MAIPLRYVLHQGPVLSGIAQAVLASKQSTPGKMPELPGPEIERTIGPRPADLVRDYIRHVGGDPGAYRGRVPAHLFPQWAFGLQARAFDQIPYPLQKALNGGCRLEINGPLPLDEPYHVKCRLEGIDDNGRRAVLHVRAITGTEAQPDAVVAHMYAIVPLGGDKKTNGAKPKKEKPRVPEDAREVAFWKIGPKAGLDFAKLTGDFNPVHWVPPYARAFGFKNCILHGFSTMARAIEGLNRGLFSGDPDRLDMVDVKFTRPLVLPASVGLYVRDNQMFVGDAAGGPAYLVGTFRARS